MISFSEKKYINSLLVTEMMIIIKLNHYAEWFQKRVLDRWMYFLIENNELLKKYNDTWNEFSNSIKKELDWKPI